MRLGEEALPNSTVGALPSGPYHRYEGMYLTPYLLPGTPDASRASYQRKMGQLYGFTWYLRTYSDVADGGVRMMYIRST